MYILAVVGEHALLSSGGPATRLGNLIAAGTRDNLPPFVPRPFRRSNDWILCLVRAGDGTYETPGAPAVAITAPAVVLVPPGTRHWYGTPADEPWTETWAVARGPVLDTLVVDDAIRGGTVRRLPDATRAARSLRDLLGRPVRGEADGERQLLDLLAWIVAAVPAGGDRFSPPVRAALDMLGSDLGAEQRIPDVARALGVGYDAFRRMFTDEVGIPPLAYRSRRRLEAAANLLRTTDLTTHAVARTLGFTDEFYLSRRFRAEYGRSPARYRRESDRG